MAVSGLIKCPFCGENGYYKNSSGQKCASDAEGAELYDNLYITSSNWRTVSTGDSIILKGVWNLGCKDCNIVLSKNTEITVGTSEGTIVEEYTREYLINKWNGFKDPIYDSQDVTLIERFTSGNGPTKRKVPAPVS